MLRAAGLDITVDPADVDEPEIEAACRRDGMATPDVALALAAAKAALVASRHPGTLVIGADQMLDVDGASLRKPEDLAAAARTLERLAGRDHTLISAVVLGRDGDVIWRHHAVARLTMRPLDAAAIADYLARAGDGVLTSVGAYQLEGLGAQLFERIEGDYFTILGLPLLALLGELRRRGAAPAGLLG
ncbi:MAG: Maf family protein [Alphaproteobacteria bacterium]